MACGEQSSGSVEEVEVEVSGKRESCQRVVAGGGPDRRPDHRSRRGAARLINDAGLPAHDDLRDLDDVLHPVMVRVVLEKASPTQRLITSSVHCSRWSLCSGAT